MFTLCSVKECQGVMPVLSVVGDSPPAPAAAFILNVAMVTSWEQLPL